MTKQHNNTSNNIEWRFFVPRSYIKTMPPEPVGGFNETFVHVSADILAILDIAEVDSFISMQIDVHMRW